MVMSEVNRSFETTHGHLKPEQLPVIDWESKEELQSLFPSYRREYIALEKTGKLGKSSSTVDIDNFNLMTPLKDKKIFVGTRLLIEPNKRCAVYGPNGSGKTILFHSIANGAIKEFPKHMSVHHMQEMSHDEAADRLSVIETVVSSHPMRRVLLPMETKLTELIAQAEEAKKDTEKLKANLAYVQWEMNRISGYTTQERAIKMLRVLGFDEAGDASLMSSLSGGLRMRVALAAAFIIEPDLLLLDEPTNHLDLPSVLWLENGLRGYKGSYLLVTHDRNLLENVVTSVILLQDQKLVPFTCGFAEFEKRKAKLDKDRDIMIDKFLLKNRNLDPATQEYRVKVEYQAWQKKRQEREVMLQGKFTFPAPPDLKTSSPEQKQEDVSLIKVENVRFSYDPAKLPFIFDTPISYEVKIGTRVGIMGPNGAGKSTFLKLITGKINATEGKITVNPDYTLAYFGQHSTKELDMDDTPIDFMVKSFPNAKLAALKSHLEKTSIGSGEQNTRMVNLSFSQRSCVIFAKLTFVPPHLLIMDEPTNFLDLDSVDSLIKAANKFKGGLIVVTHNRDFLKRTAKDFLSIVPGQFLTFETMKDAERATYSFISALESGQQIDHKAAITDNRGGGAKQTEEGQAARQEALNAQQLAAKKKADAEAAEIAAKEKELADRAAKLAAKNAAAKTDWVEGDACWAPVAGGKGTVWTKAVVKRNIPGMGVSVEVNGKTLMVEAKKLKLENPEGKAESKAAPTSGPGAKVIPTGGPGGNRSQSQKAGGSGGRGGGNGGRGGGNGGRGGGGGGRSNK